MIATKATVNNPEADTSYSHKGYKRNSTKSKSNRDPFSDSIRSPQHHQPVETSTPSLSSH